MADILIDAAMAGSMNTLVINGGPIYVDGDIGYVFYVDSFADPAYRKTEDGGATWSAETKIDAESVTKLSVWFDKHTSGDSGTIIHIAWIGTDADDVFYRTLDTATDTLGTERVVFNGATANISSRLDTSYINICKAVGGNLYIQFWIDSDGERGFYRSTDAGVNWTSRTDGADGNAVDQIRLLPDADSADNEDVAMVYWRTSVNKFFLKKYDNSGNSWGETEISADTFTPAVLSPQFDAMVRHSDGHILLVAHEESDQVTSDYRCFDINLTTPTITPKTDIITATDDVIIGSIFIDQVTDDLYVSYGGQDDGAQVANATIDVHYKKSTDGGGAWSAETTYSVAAAEDIRGIWAGRGTPGNADGRFGPAFYDIDDRDLFANFDNSVEITVAAPSATQHLLRGGILTSGGILQKGLVG